MDNMVVGEVFKKGNALTIWELTARGASEFCALIRPDAKVRLVVDSNDIEPVLAIVRATVEAAAKEAKKNESA